MKFVLNKDRINQTMKRNNKALLKAGVFIEIKLKDEVPKDTGDLARSINTKLVEDGHVRVGSNKIQAYIVEMGRKPGKFPNMDALVGWTGRKGIHSGPRTQGYDALQSKDKSKVFLVARAIATKGIKAQKTFSKTWEENKQKALDIYLSEMRK